MSKFNKNSIQFLTIDENSDGQRLDNYLFCQLKGVPKSFIYRIIRSGEVRVNKKRAEAQTRIYVNDVIRIPPIKMPEQTISGSLKSVKPQEFEIIFEDKELLVINKPAGVAVHGGSGISYGVIEQIRQARPQEKYLELVHRLDKETSGLLIIAKKRSALVNLHEQFRQNHPQKIYLALCSPKWNEAVKQVKLPLIKYTGAAGEKMVRVDKNGQYAHSAFHVVEHFDDASLVEIELKTGRTHQIRVHMQSQNCPILGDERYGNYEKNKQWAKQFGLKRMFLHAHRISFLHPKTQEKLTLTAQLPENLDMLLQKIRNM